MRPTKVPLNDFRVFLDDFIRETKGITTLAYASNVKGWSVADFRLVLSYLGVEFKDYEGRLLLLARTHKVIKDLEIGASEVPTQLN